MSALGAVLDATRAGINITARADANRAGQLEGVDVLDCSVSGCGNGHALRGHRHRFMFGVWIGADSCAGFRNVTLRRVTAANNWNTGITSSGPFEGLWSCTITALNRASMLQPPRDHY